MRGFAGLLFVAACSSPPDAPPLSALTAGTHSLQLDGASLILTTAGGPKVTIAKIELGLVDALDDGLSYDPYWYAVDDPLLAAEPLRDLRWRGPTAITLASRTASRIEAKLDTGPTTPSQLTLQTNGDDRFALSVTTNSTGPAVAWIRLTLGVDPKEGFYGLGEWPDSPNHRGKLRPMQLEPDLRLEGASDENHAPVPLLIGTKGWGLFVESRRVGAFDVATKSPDRIEVTFAGDSLRFHVFGAEHPLDVTKHYYAVTGAPALPAPWALGPLIWRDENEDQAEVEDDIDMIRDLDLATTAIWIDRPYATAVNTFDFARVDYPDPQAMIDKAHAMGLRVALWHTPYLAPDAEPLRSEAKDKGYFIPKVGFRLNNWSDPIDFTNGEAYAWWQSLIRRYTDMGIEGFKLDYGEDMIAGISGGRNVWGFADGSDDLTAHYDYTRLYHRVYAETLPVAGGFLLCRTARWGDQVVAPIIWPGDLDATMTTYRETFTDRRGDAVNGVGGLPAAVSQGLSLGPSGFAFYGSDTGGYRHSPPDNETFIRWFQHTALSVVMQVGDSSSQPPWVYTTANGRSDATLDLYRTYARLHLRLFPYLWSYASKLSDDGRAIMRPLGLAHPELGVHPADTYLLGDHLLVAPVVVRGQRQRAVRLPAGDWVHWWSGTVHSGAIEVDAPLEELPLFIRAGGIVPLLRPTIDTLSPTTDTARVDSFDTTAGVLTVRLALGPASSFEVYDGTRIEQADGVITVSPGSVFVQGVLLEVFGPKPQQVQLDGQPTTAWTHDTIDAPLLRVPVGVGAHRVEVR